MQGINRRTLVCLQHVPFEGPGVIADWSRQRGHRLIPVNLFAQKELPAPTELDVLVVMGGPMGVDDESAYSWLKAEKRLIADCIHAGKQVIGVCLGAQLIAQVLGARVYRHRHAEIGWFPIGLTDRARAHPLMAGLPAEILAFHWHNDTFDLPHGALHLAHSAACERQAFLYDGRVLGLQCHLEITPQGLWDLISHDADSLQPGPFVQTADQMLAIGADGFAQIHRTLFDLLDRL
ncbi:type 1 glutamine amidotransferase [Caldichromatium japonicum]|uniref:Type 1 glutamine amidotransferase n=1 Tax=Caldichromatium japonicum TaxID=2699430 RepID=A0A6G7VD97_9GAMM|nr:type 1 glutamine amidotransferase [Caldichromatium japonicum]QIK37944.1 type 1 glutamine amidotransferase [Caldichromatium japonicum]